MISRFDADILNKGSNGNPISSNYVKPTHCIIMGGANDCFQNLSMTDMQNNIIAMVQKCVTAGIVPILMNCPVSAYSGFATPLATQTANLKTLHDFCRDYAAANNVYFIDLHVTALLINGTQDATCYQLDMVHLSPKGSMTVASQGVIPKLLEFAPSVVTKQNILEFSEVWKGIYEISAQTSD
jgi:lysophospholipase L1-like esterase